MEKLTHLLSEFTERLFEEHYPNYEEDWGSRDDKCLFGLIPMERGNKAVITISYTEDKTLWPEIATFLQDNRELTQKFFNDQKESSDIDWTLKEVMQGYDTTVMIWDVKPKSKAKIRIYYHENREGLTKISHLEINKHKITYGLDIMQDLRDYIEKDSSNITGDILIMSTRILSEPDSIHDLKEMATEANLMADIITLLRRGGIEYTMEGDTCIELTVKEELIDFRTL